MSYKRVLEILEAYPPRALIGGEWQNATGCCAVGACAPPVAKTLGVESLAWCLRYRRMGFVTVLGVTDGELAELVRVNDERLGKESTTQRYERVVAWLRAQVAAETP